jgi:hypothetical protein
VLPSEDRFNPYAFIREGTGVLIHLTVVFQGLRASFCLAGPALGEVGEAMRELSEVKDSLDMEVKQNFIDPLQNLHDKDLREIQVCPLESS